MPKTGLSSKGAASRRPRRDFGLPPQDFRTLRTLNTPMRIQRFLDELPYDYSALEPHISGEIMELHHDKHHATYVKGANTALEQLAEARDGSSFGSLPKR